MKPLAKFPSHNLRNKFLEQVRLWNSLEDLPSIDTELLKDGVCVRFRCADGADRGGHHIAGDQADPEGVTRLQFRVRGRTGLGIQVKGSVRCAGRRAGFADHCLVRLAGGKRS